MKNKLNYLAWIGMVLCCCISCGPSKEEVEKYQNARQDSVSILEKISQDSMAAVEHEKMSGEGEMGQKDSVKQDSTFFMTAHRRHSMGSSQDMMDDDSTQRSVETHSPVEMPKLPSRGSIAFYCPKKMMENMASNISVIITKDSLEKVKKLLENRIASVNETKSKNEIKKDIEGHSIDVYAKMKVELKYSNEDIEIISAPDNPALIFDSTTKEREWDWVIRPKKLGNLQLTLVVSAFNESNGEWVSVETPPRIFNILVKVDPRNYFRKLWSFLEEHPEWIFVQVIFPVIAFFAGKRVERRKKKK